MTTGARPAKRKRPKKVVESSWSTAGAVTVTFEISAGSKQLMWLRFARRGFDALVFTDLVAVETLHAQLGAAIVAAKAEVAASVRAWAAELVANADEEVGAPGLPPNESH
jgi:hypothetical protein